MNKLLKLVLVVDMVAVNVGVGYLIYQFLGSDLGPQINSNGPIISDRVIVTEECGEECRRVIKDEVAQLTSFSVTQSSPSPTPRPVSQAVTVKKARREEILTIPGSGTTSATDWTNLQGTEFYFDTRDYPGLVEVYFEASMKLVNGSGAGYVRLYDITNGIVPTGGENNTNSQADVWTKSQKVYFWAGRNLIRVQAKSLTADTTVFNTGRLRIITEN